MGTYYKPEDLSNFPTSDSRHPNWHKSSLTTTTRYLSRGRSRSGKKR
jgi:hypothetical protein